MRPSEKQRRILRQTLNLRELECKQCKYQNVTDALLDTKYKSLRTLCDMKDKECLELEKLLMNQRHTVLSVPELRRRGMKIDPQKANFCSVLVLVYPGYYCARKRVLSTRFIYRALELVKEFDPDIIVPSPASFHLNEFQNLKAKDHSKLSLLCAWIENRKPSKRKVLFACKKLQLDNLSMARLIRFNNLGRTSSLSSGESV